MIELNKLSHGGQLFQAIVNKQLDDIYGIFWDHLCMV